jgi:hypothetical protein
MENECEYKLGELCFHPDKAVNGKLAIPCAECGLCQPNAKSAGTFTPIDQMKKPTDIDRNLIGKRSIALE